MKVEFCKTKTRQEALNSNSSGTIFFPIDSNSIIMGKKEYGMTEEDRAVLDELSNSISPDFSDSLYFEALADGSTVSMVYQDTSVANDTPITDAYEMDYKLGDNAEWEKWDGSAISLQKGEKVYFRRLGTQGFNKLSSADTYIHCFVAVGKLSVGGNLASLNGMNTKIKNFDGCFGHLFNKCSGIVDASNLLLSFEELPIYAYRYMFSECTNLVEAPQLPAKYLGNSCYQAMFYKCSSLKKSPLLPAESLSSGCYSSMFLGCTSLTEAMPINGKILANSSCINMFKECTSLVSAPQIKALHYNAYSMNYMFSGCSNLEIGADLISKTATSNSIKLMYENCPKLRYVKFISEAETSLLTSTIDFSTFADKGTFVTSQSMMVPSNMKSGWTVERV